MIISYKGGYKLGVYVSPETLNEFCDRINSAADDEIVREIGLHPFGNASHAFDISLEPLSTINPSYATLKSCHTRLEECGSDMADLDIELGLHLSSRGDLHSHNFGVVPVGAGYRDESGVFVLTKIHRWCLFTKK